MSPSQEAQLLIVMDDPQVFTLLERLLKARGYDVLHCIDQASAWMELENGMYALVLIGEKLADSSGLDFGSALEQRFPALPWIFCATTDSSSLVKRAFRQGACDFLCLPANIEEILESVQTCLKHAHQVRDGMLLENKHATSSLKRRLDELEILTRLGRTITGSLDLDAVLSAVVDAAVGLTDAEEGSLLLVDEETGELYMRAGKNFNEDFVRTFRLPTQDTLAGNVLRSGKPVMLDEKLPQKIKTSYLVHSLVYVPLQLHGHTFGVLGIDNRVKHTPIQQRDIKLLMALAEYAVIAIANAGLYANIKKERNKLEAVLTHIQDGVIVMDQDQRLILINEVAASALKVDSKSVLGRPYRDVIEQKDLLDLLSRDSSCFNVPVEIPVDDGRVFSVLLSPIAQIGMALTLHDITNLKKLDRIKSEFVSTVSHDLRSPLTAILGYTELIERVGVVNDTQRDFIRRVQFSVQNITSLINDLLDLGRIEAGFDTRKETLLLDQLIRIAVENYQGIAIEKQIALSVDLPGTLPTILANPIQMRQMIDNLLDNAIKYTRQAGTVTLRAGVAQNQIVLQIHDTGIGIPTQDLPFIFEKFYRGANANTESTGTGLGLSIVKSIVENHGGRIWVDSVVGNGTNLTVVLPVLEQKP